MFIIGAVGNYTNCFLLHFDYMVQGSRPWEILLKILFKLINCILIITVLTLIYF